MRTAFPALALLSSVLKSRLVWVGQSASLTERGIGNEKKIHVLHLRKDAGRTQVGDMNMEVGNTNGEKKKDWMDQGPCLCPIEVGDRKGLSSDLNPSLIDELF